MGVSTYTGPPPRMGRPDMPCNPQSWADQVLEAVLSDLEDEPLSLLGAGADVAGVEGPPELDSFAGADGVDDPSPADGLALSEVDDAVSDPSDLAGAESSLPALDDPFLRLSFL
jgi:hypothetical protein